VSDSVGIRTYGRCTNNVALESLRGKIGGWIFRSHRGIIEVYPATDYSRRKLSARQKASDKQFTLAVRYADAILAEPWCWWPWS